MVALRMRSRRKSSSKKVKQPDQNIFVKSPARQFSQTTAKQPETKKVVIPKKPLFDDKDWDTPLNPGQSQADKVRGILEGAVNAQVTNVLNELFETHENKLNEANDYLYAGVKEINNDLKKKPQDLDDMNMM